MSRVTARKTQVRLRQMMELLNRVEAATGSPLAAYAWFRGEPLGRPMQPLTLCACDVDADPIFDALDDGLCLALGVGASDLACPT